MQKSLSLTTILFGLLISQTALSATSQYPCDYPIMHAFTVNSTKEVKICVSGDNISYTFGNVKDTRPELDVIIPKANAEFYQYNQGEEVSVNNGKYAYTVSNLTDEQGNPIKELVVHKDNDKLTAIKLGTFEYSRITSGDLMRYGINVE